VTIPTNASLKVGDIPLDVLDPVPSSLSISSPTNTLTTVGATAQLRVMATYPNAPTKDITQGSLGTVYRTTNPTIATISENGLVTGAGIGKVIVSASNEMVLSSMMFTITQEDNPDADNDGIPDDWERANGLNPNDSMDALRDADHDGLTNKQEYDNGTLLLVADSDNDGIEDGEEIFAGRDGFVTNALLADSDGDGIKDGLEVQTGSDPINSASYNLASALSRIEVTPTDSVIVFNTIMSEASRQLTVTGILTDGARIDLTSTTRGTNYSSSDINVANFGATDGVVFAGQNGVATITAANSGFSGKARVTIKTFSPTALSSISIPGYANNVDVSGNYAYVAAGSTGLQVVDVANPLSPRIVGSSDTTGTAIDVRVVGNLAYIADGASGLQVLDITNPALPTIIGTLDTPGIAQDIVVIGTLAFIADGTSGLQIIDVSNSALPGIIGSVDTPGTAKGVAVSGNIALIADGTTLKVIDITNPALPQIIGTVNIPGETKDLVARDNYAYISAYMGGLQIVDFTNPSLPAIIGSLPSTFVPRDVELLGQFALFSEQLFPNAIPIVDITTPANPLFRAILNLSTLGDYAGTGIAVTNNYVYVTEESYIVSIDYGTSGNTRLFIGQYAEINDTGTIPPTVSITSPLDGAEVIEGSILPIVVSSTDDVAVASVNFLIDGDVVSTDNTTPYQTNYQVPMGITSFGIGATGIDLASNIASASNIFIRVIPDPPPIVNITSPLNDATFIEGNTISISAAATDNTGIAIVEFLVNGTVIATDSASPYQTNYALPNGQIGSVTLGARATDTKGKIGVATDVVVNVTPNQAPVVNITSPTNDSSAIEGSTITISATATDDTSVTKVDFLINGTIVATDTTAPYQANYIAPIGITSLTIGATATDSNGKTGTASNVSVNIIPDPGTTVIGRVVDVNSNPVSGATVTTLGDRSAITVADGSFSIIGVPTVQGNIVVNATSTINGETLNGSSSLISPVVSGITDVGAIVIIAAKFETNLGTYISESDDDYEFIAFPQGFTFPFYGKTYAGVYFNSNGRLTFSRGDTTFSESLVELYQQPQIAALFDDLYPGGGYAIGGGMFVNDTIPGKIVFTWWKVTHCCASATQNNTNTTQIILYQDGRVQIGYKEINSVESAIAGISPGTGTGATAVDFTGNIMPVTTAPIAMYEYFNIFDLANGVIIFTPKEAGGYDIGSFGVQKGTPTFDLSFRNIIDLNGVDGFLYDVEADGSLDDGGTTDQRLKDSYDDAYELSINGLRFSASLATIEDNYRELVIGPESMGSLQITRKIFLPTTSGFIRYLDIMQNTGGDTIANVYVDSDLGSDSHTILYTSPANTANTYAVTYDQHRSDPSLAHVFGGQGAAMGANSVQFVNGIDEIYYHWQNAMLPSGRTMCFMHFAIQREPYNEVGARIQAEALANLTDPNALIGMSPEEKACVVNFNIQ
jgi:hypothetical protein